ncbi:uncharacterized protein LOC5516976 [Nematostella vectensis]|uniref:uncharacterized protein LOC5516976 n=1 Tax=Nematostella vectensis TaxID=45351 RepID=UPI00207775E0|nr:uncharacterized protein LOC5516976 [Nematostella vectensis]
MELNKYGGRKLTPLFEELLFKQPSLCKMQPPQLTIIARTNIIRTLLWSCDDIRERSLILSQFRDDDSKTFLGDDVLHSIITDFPGELTDELLTLLSPPHLRHLKLTECSRVTCKGLIDVMIKCSHINFLDLSACDHLIRPTVLRCLKDHSVNLTHLYLEDCEMVTDDVLQIIMMCCPSLQHLNLSSCKNITDNAFAINSSNAPNSAETSQHVPSQRALHAGSCLSSIDISGCQHLTSTSIKHLVELCGPTLTTVNVAWTGVGCVALLHLAGLDSKSFVNVVEKADPECAEILKVVANKSYFGTQNEENYNLEELDYKNESDTQASGTSGKDRFLCDIPEEFRNKAAVLSDNKNKEAVCPSLHSTESEDERSVVAAPEEKLDVSVSKIESDLCVFKETSLADEYKQALYVEDNTQTIGVEGRVENNSSFIDNSVCIEFLKISQQDNQNLDSSHSMHETRNFKDNVTSSHSIASIDITPGNAYMLAQTKPNEFASQDQEFLNQVSWFEDILDEGRTKTSDIFGDAIACLSSALGDLVSSDDNDEGDDALVYIKGSPGTSLPCECSESDEILCECTDLTISTTGTCMTSTELCSSSRSENVVNTTITDYNKLIDANDIDIGLRYYSSLTPDGLLNGGFSDNTGSRNGDARRKGYVVQGSASQLTSGHVIDVIYLNTHDGDNYVNNANCRPSKCLYGSNNVVSTEEDTYVVGVDTMEIDAAPFSNEVDKVLVCSAGDIGTDQGKSRLSTENNIQGADSDPLLTDRDIDNEVEELESQFADLDFLWSDYEKPNGSRFSGAITSLTRALEDLLGDSENEGANNCGSIDGSGNDKGGLIDRDTTNDGDGGCSAENVVDETNGIGNFKNDCSCASYFATAAPNDGDSKPSGDNNVDPSEDDETLTDDYIVLSYNTECVHLAIDEGPRFFQNKLAVNSEMSNASMATESNMLPPTTGIPGPDGLYLNFKPHILSLDISNISFHSIKLGCACLRMFSRINTSLRSFTASWSHLDDETLIEFLGNQPGLRSLTLIDCERLSDKCISIIPTLCPHLTSIDLKGIPYITDQGVMPLMYGGRALQTVSLAEAAITDATLVTIAESAAERLQDLDLSWCEDVTDVGISRVATSCVNLRTLSLRQCDASGVSMDMLTANCHAMTSLKLSGVTNLTDSMVSCLAFYMPQLDIIDLSWNSSLTDVGISAVLLHCSCLKKACLSGLKLITSKPFLRIIGDLSRWRINQGMLQLKKKAESGPGHSLKLCDTDIAKRPETDLPFRSQTYAPLLKQVVLEYSDKINDDHLAQIVAVCRGTLLITDYYAMPVKPKWIY